MRYIRWQQHKELIRNFVFLVMGIYLGMFICLYFYGNQLDQLLEDNNKLTIELDTCTKENETLNQEMKHRQNLLIRSIRFHFTEKVDSFIETELLKALMEETEFLLGKKVEDIKKSPEFIYQLLNDRTYTAKDKAFRIRVKIISIHSVTEIWISVKE